MSRTTFRVALATSLLLTGTAPAYAYLDPGTGSILLQSILGAVAGGLVLGRTYLFRLKKRLGLSSRSSEMPDRPSE